jgi:hypothetical protein
MKPPSITDAYSNFGTEQRKNRGESREQAQYRMAKRYGIMAESWQQYIQPLLFTLLQCSVPATSIDFLLLAESW